MIIESNSDHSSKSNSGDSSGPDKSDSDHRVIIESIDKSDSDHRVIIESNSDQSAQARRPQRNSDQIKAAPVTGDPSQGLSQGIRSKSDSESESESDCFRSERASAGAFFGRPRERAFFII